MFTRTSQYNFAALEVGKYIQVYTQFQHARVAASEYGRKHNKVFTCRKQEDGSMKIYRVANDQANVDRRGRNAMRAIPVRSVPTFTPHSTVSYYRTV